MRVRAVASDYDDTLARAGTVSPEALCRVLATKRSGVKMVLVTGRNMAELREVFDEISALDLVVAENGGYLFAPASNAGWRVAPEVEPAVAEELRRRGVTPLFVGETVISTYTPHEGVVREVLDPAAGFTNRRYDLIRNRGSLMILPEGIDKGSGLREGLRFLRIPTTSAVAVGDAENDLEFVKAAGYGVAVGDAIDELKQAADLVTEGQGPDGFIELIDMLVAANFELHLTEESREDHRRAARAG